jgi:trimeric autotransporter adhesin
MKNVFLLIFAFWQTTLSGQIITTFAGNGIAANAGDGMPATNASIDYPTGGAFDKFGNFYFTLGTHGNGVRKVSVAGIITRVAGTGISGFSGDGGLATDALLNNAQTVAINSDGDLYIGDNFNNRIRKVDGVSGVITTIAGTGASSFNGDGSALTTNIEPNNLCFDNLGNLYFSDGSYRIRKLDNLGLITTVAGNGIAGFGGNNVPATSVPINPFGICFDNLNNLYFADDYGRIYKINSAGSIFYFAGNGVGGYSGDGGPASAASMRPTYIKMDRYGNMFVCESSLARVRLVNSSGIISTLVGNGIQGYSGDGGLSSLAQINYPGGIALDTCGHVYIADAHDWRIRKVTFPGCDFLNVDELSRGNTMHISIYPNPTSNELTITAPEKISSAAIMNIVGQTVAIGTYNNKERVMVDVGHLPAGVYLVRVNDRYIQKLIKE